MMSKKYDRIYIFGMVLTGALLLLSIGKRAEARFEQRDVAASGLTPPLGTAFTYQGLLEQDGTAVNASCDFQFSLWDAAGGGSQMGSTLDVNGVAVAEGLFTAQLDFGGGVFDGQGRWLEVAVRCPAGGGSYTTLGRQALTGTPQALFALDAGLLEGQPGSYYQAAVAGNCILGSSIRVIHPDGTVDCQVDAPLNRQAPPQNNTITTLDIGVTVRSTSTTIGVDGLGLISYYDNTTQDLKVAHCNDLACTSATITTLDSVGDVGRSNSITIGTDGLGLISYYENFTGNLKVAHCSDLACTSATITTLDSAGNVGGATSITIGADGLGLISYHDYTNTSLKVAHCSDLACSSATSTTLDSSGDVGLLTSITIGADGLGLIGYYDNGNGDLKVAQCSNLVCESAIITTLDSTGDAGWYTSITIGVDGLGLVSYRSTEGGINSLKVAHCNDLPCTSATINTVDSPGAGGYSSITIGADGLGLISYLDSINNALKLAHCTDLACTSAAITTLDSSGVVGWAISITIGTDGLGLITYHDVASDELKIAHCSNVFCVPFFKRR